jgi:hypothetical protein
MLAQLGYHSRSTAHWTRFVETHIEDRSAVGQEQRRPGESCVRLDVMNSKTLASRLTTCHDHSFGAAAKEQEKLMYCDASFLIGMALADSALFSYQTVADIRRQKLPAGDTEMELRWN